jgi:hypothetical protein
MGFGFSPSPQRENEVNSLKSQVEALLKERVDQEHAHEDWRKQYESINESGYRLAV